MKKILTEWPSIVQRRRDGRDFPHAVDLLVFPSSHSMAQLLDPALASNSTVIQKSVDTEQDDLLEDVFMPAVFKATWRSEAEEET